MSDWHFFVCYPKLQPWIECDLKCYGYGFKSSLGAWTKAVYTGGVAPACECTVECTLRCDSAQCIQGGSLG